MLAAAVGYAQSGEPVFPCAPGRKVPLYQSPHPKGSPERSTCRGECGRWGHGVLDATTDTAIVTAWWTRTPSANVAKASGAPGSDVVDVDTKHGSPGAASFARLRDAGLLRGAYMVVTTPSGGWHLYFAGTEQGNSTRARHGIDFRGRGGYVLAPPSIVDGRRYEVAEYREPTGQTVDWAAIRNFLDPKAQRAVGVHRSGDPAGLARWLAEQREGNRNSALHWAACRAVETGADPWVFDALATAAVGLGLSTSEADRTIQSAQRGGSR